jgi:uncharacterized protein (TIGR00369 family)
VAESHKQPSSRGCFLCGRENPISLKVSWFNEPAEGRIRARVSVPESHCSYPGVVHGGIVSTLLDETGGRAVMVGGDFERLMVSVKLEVEFRRVTPSNVTLDLVGWVVRDQGSKVEVAAEIRLPDGAVSARSHALLVRPPADVAARFAAEREHWKVVDD